MSYCCLVQVRTRLCGMANEEVRLQLVIQFEVKELGDTNDLSEEENHSKAEELERFGKNGQHHHYCTQHDYH